MSMLNIAQNFLPGVCSTREPPPGCGEEFILFLVRERAPKSPKPQQQRGEMCGAALHAAHIISCLADCYYYYYYSIANR
jgi:hypothetical protein